MNKLIKGIVIAAAALSFGGILLSNGYTHMVSEEVTNLRRESRSDIVYLRNRVRELESELTAGLLDRLTPPDEAVDGVIDEETIPAPAETDTVADTETEDVLDNEEVTVPTHMAPETQPTISDGVESESSPAAMYILTVYNGVIGIYDASGELVKTINCFVMTLPEAEREALEVGIPAYSYEEMCGLAEQYE